MDLNRYAQELLELYQQTTDNFSSFQKSAGLGCPSGCVKCCQNPQIEASPSEMIPMALKIGEQGLLEEWLDKLDQSADMTCAALVVHGESSQTRGSGFCRYYEERPIVCRVFGVAAVKDKYQEKRLSLCAVLKENYPVKANHISEVSKENELPLISDWTEKFYNFDPELVTRKYPINEALKLALQRVYYYRLESL